MQNGHESQPLREILLNEGLTFKAVSQLCPPRAQVSDQTIADIAMGRKGGSERLRQRILNALNRYDQRKRDYGWSDLYRDPLDKDR